MPDNLIFRILEDDKNNLFVSTSKGLVCFNPVNGRYPDIHKIERIAERPV